MEIRARLGSEQAAGHRLHQRLDGRGPLGLLQALLRGRDELAVRGEQRAISGEVLLVEHHLVLDEQLADLLQVLQPPQPHLGVAPSPRSAAGPGRRHAIRRVGGQLKLAVRDVGVRDPPLVCGSNS